MMLIVDIWTGLLRELSHRCPKRFRQRGFRVGIYAAGAFNAHIIAFGRECCSPTVESNAFHIASFMSRCQRLGFAPSADDNKIVEEWHRYCNR